MKIGILALQGAVREHSHLLERVGATGIPIKYASELETVDGLILPGGESTTMRKMMDAYNLMEPLRRFHEQGKPIFGTCAGLILIANELDGEQSPHLRLLDVSVKRNAFGRQRESFEALLDVQGIGSAFMGIFIRAPYISHVGQRANVLAEYEDKVVAVQQGTLLGASFHPELTDDSRFHAYFVAMVKESLENIGNTIGKR